MPELSELLELHKSLDDMFFSHQVALLRFNFPLAHDLLEKYELALLRHMKDEEEVLIPIYSQRANITKAGDPRLFLDEHEKMRRYVELFRTKTVSLFEEREPEVGVIMLLDREAFYKRLCSHHDKRESEILYPELDRVTTLDERTHLLGRVARDLTVARGSEV